MGPYQYLIERLIFFPEKVLEFIPSQLETPYEDIFFRSQDGTILHGWFFPWPGANRTLIYFHGNAGNISHRIDKVKALRKIGLNIFLFDYREYGGSEGKASITGVKKDAYAAYQYIAKKEGVNPNHIILHGSSMGAALVAELATQEPVSAVILESAFPSLKEIAKVVYPLVPSTMVPDEFRAIDHVRALRAPLLVIHGMEDEIVPLKLGRKLWDAAPQPKRFYPLPGGHHNDLYMVGGERYLNEIEEFLRQVGG